jgi:hypothetical protein
MLVVFPGDGDDMMFMTKRLPNSQVISKRRKHPNLYNNDNTEWITSAPAKPEPTALSTRGKWARVRESEIYTRRLSPPFHGNQHPARWASWTQARSRARGLSE